MAIALKIKAKRNGFRRAGFSFSDQETIIPVNDLTKEQVEALKAEPNLLVSEIEIKEQESDPKKDSDENEDVNKQPSKKKA